MDTARLRERIEQLKQRPGADHATLHALHDWIVQSEPITRHRINPYLLVQHHQLDLNTLVSEMLYAVPVGMLDLHWDVHCPHCNMVTVGYKHLSSATSTSSCPMCVGTFAVDFLQRVEVAFSLNNEIEGPILPPNFCVPVPALNARYQLAAPLGQRVGAEETLDAGVYRYFCPITLSKGILTVEGESTACLQEFQVVQLPQSFDPTELRARPGPIKITLVNDSVPLAGLFLTLDDLPPLRLDQLPARLTGLQISHHPVFRELFRDEVLSERERLLISSVTTMFTDITGSTQMYENLGDAVAYNIVRDHFEILFGSITSFGGRVIKTIGDAVMASFLNNEQAMRSIGDFLHQLDAYNQRRQMNEQVWLKIGLHRGPVILVNLNERLDYFGSAVNKAARIQALSRSGEISFSEQVANDQAFMAMLEETRTGPIRTLRVNLKGLEGAQTVYQTQLVQHSPGTLPQGGRRDSMMQRVMRSLGLSGRQ